METYLFEVALEPGGGAAVKTYVLKAEIEQDEDGRWGAAVPALPGCAT
jgi:hypothetical protein